LTLSNLIDIQKDYDELQVTEVPKPRVKEGEVLVKVEAAGVNFADLLYVSALELQCPMC